MRRLTAVPWTTAAPPLALVVLAATWGRDPATFAAVVVGLVLAAAALEQGGVHLVLFGAFLFLAVNP